jgi:hypothetical protein
MGPAGSASPTPPGRGDIVGGKPSEGIEAAREEAVAATREASAEVRQQAEQIAHPGKRKDDDKD